MMRKWRVSMALAAVMVVGLVLPAAAGSGQEHLVSVGGADAAFVDPGGNANFSMVVMENKDGSVRGQWQDSFGHGDGGIHVAVKCLRVLNNVAYVSGVITQASGIAEEFVGETALTQVVDNGKTGDQISLSFLNGGDPATLCETTGSLPLFDVNNGQVKVR